MSTIPSNQPIASREVPGSNSGKSIASLEAFLEDLQQRSGQMDQRREFYGWLLISLAQFLPNTANLVFSVREEEKPTLIARRFKPGFAESGDGKSWTRQLIQESRQLPQDAELVVIAEQSTLRVAANLEGGLLVVLALIPEPMNGPSELWLDLLNEIRNSLAVFEQRRLVRKVQTNLERRDRELQVLARLTAATSVTELAVSLVNDLLGFTKAERISFFEVSGRVRASSGVALISSRSPLGKCWQRLVQKSGSAGVMKDFRFDNESSSTGSDQRAWELALEMSQARAAIIAPFPGDPGKGCRGVLVFEYFDELPVEWEEEKQQIEEVLVTMGPFLQNTRRKLAVPGLRAGIWYSELTGIRLLQSIAIWLSLGILMVYLYGYLFQQQRAFELTVQGRMEPEVKRGVFAPVAGIITDYLVSDGGLVQQGQPLALLKSLELEQERARNQGLLAEALQTLNTLQFSLNNSANSGTATDLDRMKITGQIEETKIQIKTLQQMEEFWRQRWDLLTVRAPVTGSVSSKEFQSRLLSRPVAEGEQILEVVELDGPWRLRMAIPQRWLGHITAYQRREGRYPELQFHIVTRPELTFTGEICEFDFDVVPSEIPGQSNEAVVWANVEINEQVLLGLLQEGTAVWGKLHCGSRTNWFLWTYELQDKFRDWFFY